MILLWLEEVTNHVVPGSKVLFQPRGKRILVQNSWLFAGNRNNLACLNIWEYSVWEVFWFLKDLLDQSLVFSTISDELPAVSACMTSLGRMLPTISCASSWWTHWRLPVHSPEFYIYSWRPAAAGGDDVIIFSSTVNLFINLYPCIQTVTEEKAAKPECRRLCVNFCKSDSTVWWKSGHF